MGGAQYCPPNLQCDHSKIWGCARNYCNCLHYQRHHHQMAIQELITLTSTLILCISTAICIYSFFVEFISTWLIGSETYSVVEHDPALPHAVMVVYPIYLAA